MFAKWCFIRAFHYIPSLSAGGTGGLGGTGGGTGGLSNAARRYMMMRMVTKGRLKFSMGNVPSLSALPVFRFLLGR
jgi:hypothetical protein